MRLASKTYSELFISFIINFLILLAFAILTIISINLLSIRYSKVVAWSEIVLVTVFTLSSLNRKMTLYFEKERSEEQTGTKVLVILTKKEKIFAAITMVGLLFTLVINFIYFFSSKKAPIFLAISVYIIFVVVIIFFLLQFFFLKETIQKNCTKLLQSSQKIQENLRRYEFLNEFNLLAFISPFTWLPSVLINDDILALLLISFALLVIIKFFHYSRIIKKVKEALVMLEKKKYRKAIIVLHIFYIFFELLEFVIYALAIYNIIVFDYISLILVGGPIVYYILPISYFYTYVVNNKKGF